MTDFFDVIKSRHSVRAFDPGVSILKSELKQIIREATLAPSGHNLQPWRFLIVTDPKIKEKMLPVAFGQKQVVESSAVIMVLADLSAVEKMEQILELDVEKGLMAPESKPARLARVIDFYGNPEKTAVARETMIVDAALVSMQLMLVARAHGYDTVPMVWYDMAGLRKLLKISERYASVLMIPIGKAREAAVPTSRLEPEDVVFWEECKES